MEPRQIQRCHIVLPTHRNWRCTRRTSIAPTLRIFASGRRGIYSFDRRLRHARETSGELKLCRDPDDDEILEAAIVGKSQYLVTRDDDLKRDLDLIKIARRNRVRVVSVRQFLRRLSRQAVR